MNNLTPEMIEKAKAARSAEELLALAKENNVEMTEDEAKTYFAQLNPKGGEVSDDELENVSGGGCSDPEVPCYGSCERWVCRKCGTPYSETVKYSFGDSRYCHNCKPWRIVSCEDCKYSYQGGTNDMITYCTR